MSRRRDIRKAKHAHRSSRVEPDPMNHMANLVDAMLVLAVGMMLALVINWNIDMISTAEQQDTKAASNNNVPTFEDENLEAVDAEEVKDKGDLEKSGTAYYDPDEDKYYLMED